MMLGADMVNAEPVGMQQRGLTCVAAAPMAPTLAKFMVCLLVVAVRFLPSIRLALDVRKLWEFPTRHARKPGSANA